MSLIAVFFAPAFFTFTPVFFTPVFFTEPLIPKGLPLHQFQEQGQSDLESRLAPRRQSQLRQIKLGRRRG